jgi:hypothetical protein
MKDGATILGGAMLGRTAAAAQVAPAGGVILFE